MERDFVIKGIGLELYGYPAYVVDRLVGVTGRTREEVLEQMVQEWVSNNKKRLSEMGINAERAKELGYIWRKT